MNYFNNSLNFSKSNQELYFIKGFNFLLKPFVGDVLKFFFSKKGAYYFFEGFCFSLTKKKFLSFDSAISLVYKVKVFLLQLFLVFLLIYCLLMKRLILKDFFFF